MRQADLQFTRSGATLICRIRGELDMSSAERVGAAVIKTTQPDDRGVVLDLSDVDYLDSAGVYVLFGLRETLRERDQVLALVVPERSPADEALALAGIKRQPDVALTVSEAVQAMQSRGATA